jgi:hypothetical protein
MEVDKQSKRFDLAKEQTAQSKPKELTPKYVIPIGRGQKLYIQCQQWGNGQKFLYIAKCEVHPSNFTAYFFFPNQITLVGFEKLFAQYSCASGSIQICGRNG